MSRFAWLVLVALVVSPAYADDDESPINRGHKRPPSTVSFSELAPTPEMWFYDQEMRLYNDPKYMVRRNAEFAAQQRERRIESRRWFGYSNLRPRASSDPIHGHGSPHWVSNTYDPYSWAGVRSSIYVAYPWGYHELRK